MCAARNSLDRRQFLARLSAASLILGGHPPTALGEEGQGADRLATPADPEPRILEIDLLSQATLADMKSFYGDQLGFPLLDETERAIVFRAGASKIRFEQTAGADSAPFYHFTFNIPENKLLAAREWQLERTPLFVTPENLRDPEYPDDVRHFRNWNAHSIFFWDPAGNVVEYIARHDLRNGAPGPFTSADLLYLSEIAFVVDDVPSTASVLQSRLALGQYGSGGEPFWAVGDERGLLLLFKRGRQIGDRLRGRPAAADVFSTRARIHGTTEVTLELSGFPYAIESTA